MDVTRHFISVWTLTRKADGRPNLYLHAGRIRDDGTIEWEKPYWHPVSEEAASHYTSMYPPTRRDVRRWGRPDETLVATWEGDDWEEEDLNDEDEE
jgi:hypothetical protein